MDQRQFLIRINQMGQWQTKTKMVESIAKIENYYEVKFHSGSKTYKYKVSNVEFYDNPQIKNIQDYIVEVNGQHIQMGNEARVFGNYTCFYVNGTCRVERSIDVALHENTANTPSIKRLVDYYGFIVNQVKEKSPHLDYGYSKFLTSIRGDSALSLFAQKGQPEQYASSEKIFPFGINLSQHKAVSNALENQISVIQGPPGTGKTQTILNIIANLIVNNKSVAIVSGNNSATDNVFEKLQPIGLDFLVARLGNNKLLDAFFSSKRVTPDFKNWKLSESDLSKFKGEVYELNSAIQQLLEAKNELARIKEEIHRIKIERQYFERQFDVEAKRPEDWSFSKKWSTDRLLKFLAELEYLSTKGKVNWPRKLQWIFKYGIYNFKELGVINESHALSIIKEFYTRLINEKQNKRDQLLINLENNNFDSLLDQLVKTSMKVFLAIIAKKFEGYRVSKFDKNNYKSNFKEFLKVFPVVLSTTDSIANNKNKTVLFDYIIVDEASQVDLVTSALAMSCAKNMVVVGDMKQLPHIPNSMVTEALSSTDNYNDIDPGYCYINESLLSSVIKLFPNTAPNTLLIEHYRCHPRIIDFCNQKFYSGKLVVMTESAGVPFKAIETAPGNHARKPKSRRGWINTREFDVINQELVSGELKIHSNDIGIASPYREQVDLLAENLSGLNVHIDTVHKYQGREKDVIIFATTANSPNSYVEDPRLINVAVSRAKKELYVITSNGSFRKQGSIIGDLIRHIQYQSDSPAIYESKIVSIFDCLYAEYNDILNDFMKKVAKVSEFQSENLMAALLDEVLSTNVFSSFAYKMNYPLNLLVPMNSELTDRERSFARHPFTHIDFIIFNKLDKSVVLAIEVDGYHFHNMVEKQLERDNVKNQVLNKIGIPIVRFSTTESEERKRLVELLTSLMTNIPESVDSKLRGTF